LRFFCCTAWLSRAPCSPELVRFSRSRMDKALRLDLSCVQERGEHARRVERQRCGELTAEGSLQLHK
jgi:hypothetical protein